MAAKVWCAAESLKGFTTLLWQPEARIWEFVENLARFCEVNGLHEPSAITSIDTNTHIVRGALTVSVEVRSDFNHDIGSSAFRNV